MNGPWIIPHSEFQQCEIQFISLRPIDGFLNGDQARGFFMQSGLPPQLLGQIWNLADLTRDGKLDKLEFCIAMKLIRNVRNNIPLPNVLPDSLKQIAPPPPQPLMQLPAYGMPQMPPMMPNNIPGQMPQTIQPPQFVMGTKELCEWSIPHQNKLKYSQKFNQLDRDRNDYLTGQQVRGVMGESQLPAPILAQIWNFADSNKDGYLTIERFCVAMFLIEKVKEGYALPTKVPPELQSYMSRSKTESPATTPQEPGAPPPQKTPVLKSFDDKRRDNLNKGEEELQRRREILQAEENRRKAEIERKEREEAERREAERQEMERKRQEEMERLMEQQRKLEEERRIEEERIRAEREEARKKADEERMKLLILRHENDLETQLQGENEKTAQIKQRHKTMTFQLQGLDEKAQQLSSEITEARDEIMSITTEIEGMRKQRDEKIGKIQALQAKNQEVAISTERFSHQTLQLQTDSQKSLSRTREIDSLRRSIEERKNQITEATTAISEAKDRLKNQEKLIAEKKPAYDEGQEKLGKLAVVYNDLLQKFIARQQELHQKVMQKRQQQQQSAAAAFQVPKQPSQELYQLPPDTNDFAPTGFGSTGFGDSFVPGTTAPPAAQSTTVQNAFASPTSPTSKSIPHLDAQNTSNKLAVKYRVLYEFVARSPDELSLQPGDTILVFEDHPSEPGWLAGQFKDKVGWLPASFAEPISKKTNNTTTKQSSITTSPSTEPLESIKEEPTEAFTADHSSAFTPSASSNSVKNIASTLEKQAVNSSLPLYDAPPGNIPLATTTNNDQTNDSQGNGSTTVIATGTASFAWKPRHDHELSFSRGDKIEIYEVAEMRYRGAVSGTTKTGWMPKSYVKLDAEGVKKSPSNLSNNKLANQTSVESQHSAKNGVDRRASSTSGTVATAATLQSPTNGTTNGGNGEWFVAVYDFQAVESTDLSLKVGDRILVNETKDDWWHGTVDGRSGIFPGNYVQRASNTPLSSTAPTEAGPDSGMDKIARAIAAYEATSSNQLSLNVGDVLHVYNVTDAGWSEAEVDRDGSKNRGWVPTNYLKMMSASSTPVDAGVQLADAAFDYVSQRDDELSFKAGDVIEIVDKSGQWWKGRIYPSKDQALMFPANYVQLRGGVGGDVSFATNNQSTTHRSVVSENPNLKKQIQELIETEDNFCNDLLMVRNGFMKQLIGVIALDGIEKIFLNWDQLIKISKRLHTDLLKYPPGQVFCKRIDILEAFVQFCEGQQAAIAYLNQLEKSNAKFRKVYQQCVQESKGMSLSYYLLLPMSRITRYPLIFEKIIKYSQNDDPEYEHLHDAHQLLKSLVARVNQAISELENKNILCWSQQNIRCDSLSRALEFTSDTRELGPREYLHSGVLYKHKSNKMLVGFLYNDFLLLTVPNETIEDPDSFKVSKELSFHLTLYKAPMILKDLEVDSVVVGSASNEDNSFTLKNKNMQIQLRAPTKNAKSFWVNQLQKAIDQYDVKTQLKKAEEQRKSSITHSSQEIGRLLVEILSLKHANSNLQNLMLKLHLDESDEPVHQAQITTIRDGQSIHTTQFSLHSMKQKFYLSIYVPMQFRPDIKLGDVVEDIQKIVQIKGQHNGPIIRNLQLKNSEISGGSNSEVNIKFFVQLFSSNI